MSRGRQDHVTQPAVVYEELVAGESWNADEALTLVYSAHYSALVRLGALLLHDAASAEEIVQDAFVAMHSRWHRLRDPDKALAYLRTTVVNKCRSRQRHLVVVDKRTPKDLQDVPSAEQTALAGAHTGAVIEATGALREKQST